MRCKTRRVVAVTAGAMSAWGLAAIIVGAAVARPQGNGRRQELVRSARLLLGEMNTSLEPRPGAMLSWEGIRWQEGVQQTGSGLCAYVHLDSGRPRDHAFVAFPGANGRWDVPCAGEMPQYQWGRELPRGEALGLREERGVWVRLPDCYAAERET